MKKQAELTGRRVLLLLCAFFGVMVVANAAFVTFAVRSFPGESQKKSYMQGIHYNETLAARTRQATLGWRAEITQLGASAIEVRMFDADDAPLTGLNVGGSIERPSHSGADQDFVCDERSPGVYAAKFTTLDKGAWKIAAIASGRDDARFEFTARVTIP